MVINFVIWTSAEKEMHELQYDLAYFKFYYVSLSFFTFSCSGFLLQTSFILFLDYFAKLAFLKHKTALVMMVSPAVPGEYY